MPRRKSKKKPFYKRISFSSYMVIFILLFLFYFTYRYRHGILYYYKIVEKTIKGEKLTDQHISKYDIRNIEVMDNYYLKTFGVDVSHYQGKIEWAKMHTIYQLYPIKFAYIRSTIGIASVDQRFEENWTEIQKTNILRGAYHFYRPDENSTLQARNFIQKVSLKKGDLPPVVDIEHLPKTQSMTKLIEGVKNWCNIIEEHYNVKPIIYTSDKYYEDYLQKHFDGHLIWIANYNFWTEKIKGHWNFWQFTEKATIDGVKNHKIDVNIYNGTFDDLKRLAL